MARPELGWIGARCPVRMGFGHRIRGHRLAPFHEILPIFARALVYLTKNRVAL
jgi:hypothetical protein